jgi:hypothetical protein
MMLLNPGPVAALVSVAALAVFAAACGSGGDAAEFGLGPQGAPTPTIVPSATEPALPQATPTYVSVFDEPDELAQEVGGFVVELPEPTPTFDPGEVILPTVSALTLEVPDLLDAELKVRLDEIEPGVAALRELYAVADTVRRFITQAELEERLSLDLAEQREEFDDYSRLYEVMGITEPGTDLYDLFLDLYSSSVLGFFDPELNELYVVDDDASELSPRDHLTYIHEFVHALQQQHFDIGSVLNSDEVKNNSDRGAAYRALVEGDATLLETIYMFQNMTAEEQASAQDLGVDLSSFFASPHLVQRTFLFPYLEGAQFVLEVFADSGWKGVNALYGRAPVSTEQVMHPAKYQLAEPPIEVVVPELENVLGEGWSELVRDTFGEFSLVVYLEDFLSRDQAAIAGAGWGGDRYVLYGGPDGVNLLVHMLAWDSARDAAEFFGAFAGFTEARLQTGWELLDEAGRAARMTLPGQVIFAVNRGTTTDLIFAPDNSTLATVLGELDPGFEFPPDPDMDGAEPGSETSTEP